jgi:hypothetical protein
MVITTDISAIRLGTDYGRSLSYEVKPFEEKIVLGIGAGIGELHHQEQRVRHSAP